LDSIYLYTNKFAKHNELVDFGGMIATPKL